MTEIEIENIQLEYAENQFVGFFHAQKGYGIKMLVESMGLKKHEWLKIKTRMRSYFSETDIQEIDNLLR